MFSIQIVTLYLFIYSIDLAQILSQKMLKNQQVTSGPAELGEHLQILN